MKNNKKIVLIILCCVGMSVAAQNPISPMGVYLADPAAHVMPDGHLYVYGSNDESRNHYCSAKQNVLSTSDMKTWTLTEDVFTLKEANSTTSNKSAMILYAPDAVSRNGKYYYYYCLADNTEGVAESNSPLGTFRKGTKLPVAGIDPAVFVDDDGQAYYYWGQFSAKGCRLNKDMKTLNLSTMKDSLVTEKKHHFHEGGWVFKRNGIYYYVYTALNEKAEATAIGYAMSSSPMGPFKYGGIIIDNAGCDPGTWNNHGSVVEYKGQWYVFYHRSTHACQMMRKACVEKISFNADGTIPQVEMTSQGASDPLDAFRTIDAARACLLTGKMRVAQSAPYREELARIEHYDLATYKYLNFSRKPHKIIVRVAPQAGGRIQVLTDSYAVRGTVTIPAGDGKSYQEFTASIQDIPEGVVQLRLRFEGVEDKDLMRIDSFRFE
jgi:arabinoxylan arabinofuranohydrolase